MPYSDADSVDLPINVRKLNKKKREEWVSTFNSIQADKDNESSALAIADAAIRTKGWIEDTWEVTARQLNTDDVEYKPLGSTEKSGCAACNWFVSPDCCVLVYGDISPTGLCKLYMDRPAYEVEPMPVFIVEQDKSILARLKSWLRWDSPVSIEKSSAVSDIDIDGASLGAVQGSPPIMFYKDDDGIYRFFTAFTNSYEDKHGETLIALSHKDYVDWVTESGMYPDLRLWHCGEESRIGKIDFTDFVDGFVVSSGIIDKEKSHIVPALQNQEIATSHGFVGLITKSGEVVKYRTFEISVLPAWAAANIGTNFNIKNIGEKEMPFSEAKKVWLKDVAKVDDATITAWEKSVEELGAKFKELGLEYKEGEGADIAVEIQNVTKAISDLASVVKTQQTSIEILSKSQDDKIAEVFKSEVAKLPQGFRASESVSTIISKEEAKPDIAWFENIVKGVTS